MNIAKTYFEIQQRKYSSNVIVRVDMTLDKGKEELHKKTFLIPAGKKIEGDQVADFILRVLQEPMDK